MHRIKHQFIEFALQKQVLRFGEFTLKSGRLSPYFFNAGLFHDGESLKQLGQFYAQTIIESGITFDVLFGPAYKGIPLGTTTSVALSQQGFNPQVSFNRKEAKAHGEGGNIIGAPLQGKVLMIDDVITAGTAFRESKQLIEAQGAKLCGVVIALNRQERGQGELSAIQEIEQQHQIPVIPIITLADLIEYLKESEQQQPLQAIAQYQQQYGC